MSIPNEFKFTFLRKEKVAKNTYSFYFDTKKMDFSFLPGQYVRMILDIKNPDNRGNSRFFTISSSPLDKDRIVITTRIIESSFKKKMLKLVPGERVKFFGPMGRFYFDEKNKTERVFLAGGIGLTPFHSMIKYADSKKLSIPMTLIVSFSTYDEVVFYKDLTEISKRNQYINVVFTITRPDKNWNGEKGRISEKIIRKYVKNINKTVYSIVGPPAMVSDIEEIVTGMNVVGDNIFIENFTGY